MSMGTIRNIGFYRLHKKYYAFIITVMCSLVVCQFGTLANTSKWFVTSATTLGIDSCKSYSIRCQNDDCNLDKTLQKNQLVYRVSFVLQSRSLMYCAVPKVATKTLLTLMLYIHLSDIQRNLRNNWTNIDMNRTRIEQTMDISTFTQDLRKNGITIPKTEEPKSLDEFLQMYLHILQFGNINGTASLSRRPPNPWRAKFTYAFPYLRLFNLINLSQIFSSSFTRIIFVRHPFERLASAYTERIATRSRDRIEPEPEYDAIRFKICYQRMWLKKPHERVYNDPCEGGAPSFEDFIRYILIDTQSSVQISRMDFHWQPYSSICQVCKLRYNFIGQYETFNKDLNSLIRSFNVSNWIIRNQFSSSDLMKWKYQKFYFNLPDDLICQLIRLYEEDFRLFKYPINEYINRTDFIKTC